MAPAPCRSSGCTSTPTARAFLRRETLLGTNRVVPSGRGRVVVLPSSAWFLGAIPAGMAPTFTEATAP